MKINRKIVESYLNKKVEIVLFDNAIIKGHLIVDTSGYSPKNKWYHTINPNSPIMFRVSHIKHIKEVK